MRGPNPLPDVHRVTQPAWKRVSAAQAARTFRGSSPYSRWSSVPVLHRPLVHRVAQPFCYPVPLLTLLYVVYSTAQSLTIAASLVAIGLLIESAYAPHPPASMRLNLALALG